MGMDSDERAAMVAMLTARIEEENRAWHGEGAQP